MHDVIIIGSGPAGLTAAIYTARAGLDTLVVEGMSAGGQLTITSEVENFPGFPDGIQGPELMQRMRRQAEKFGAAITAGEVTAVSFTAETRSVTIGSETIEAKAVIATPRPTEPVEKSTSSISLVWLG